MVKTIMSAEPVAPEASTTAKPLSIEYAAERIPAIPAPAESMLGPVAMPVAADIAPVALAGIKCTHIPTSTPPRIIAKNAVIGSIFTSQRVRI